MFFLSLLVLTIYQLRLFGVQLQIKALQSLAYRLQQVFSFGFTIAVYDDVISQSVQTDWRQSVCSSTYQKHGAGTSWLTEDWLRLLAEGLLSLRQCCHLPVLCLPLTISLCRGTPTSPSYDGSPSSSSTRGWYCQRNLWCLSQLPMNAACSCIRIVQVHRAHCDPDDNQMNWY